MRFALDVFLGEARPVDVPVLKTIGQIVAITVVPVSIGMVIRAKKPGFADRMERPARIGSAVVFVLITVGIIAANLDLLEQHFWRMIGITLALNVATMALGFGAARLFRLNLAQSIAVTIESGVQNGTLAIVLATSVLAQGDLALPAGIYSLVMFATGGVVMVVFGAWRDPREHAQSAKG